MKEKQSFKTDKQVLMSQSSYSKLVNSRLLQSSDGESVIAAGFVKIESLSGQIALHVRESVFSVVLAAVRKIDKGQFELALSV